MEPGKRPSEQTAATARSNQDHRRAEPNRQGCVVLSDRAGPTLDNLEKNISMNFKSETNCAPSLCKVVQLEWCECDSHSQCTNCDKTSGVAELSNFSSNQAQSGCPRLQDKQQFDILLGADLFYEPRAMPALLATIERHLAPGGV
jgi:hypothetical protein